MKRLLTTWAAGGLILAWTAAAGAIDLGSWNSDYDPLQTGVWTETFGEGGEGSPGSRIWATDNLEDFGDRWVLDHLYTPVGGGPEAGLTIVPESRGLIPLVMAGLTLLRRRS